MQQNSPPPMSPAGRPIRLVFLLPGMVMGGAERHGLDLMRRFGLAGYDTRLVIHGSNATDQMEAIVRALGAVLLQVRGMSSLPGWLRVWRELKRQDADVIFCVNHTVAIVATALKALGLIRSKVVCVLHTTILQPNDRKNFFLFRWSARALDALVYVSGTQKRYWEANGVRAQRSVSITNGVDLAEFSDLAPESAVHREALGLAAEDYVIGIVAGLRPEKNHEELIEALAILRGAHARAKVLIVGEGRRRLAIEARIKALDLEDHVVLVGEQPDVRPYIRLCDVCVLCSTTETFSLAALEVLALGAPVVSSDVGGMSEIIDPEVNGLLYPSGDPAALADCLLRIARPEVRQPMRAAARGSVLRRDIGHMMGQYVDLVRALTGR
ncbi:MAG TPA: glycosyltransferase [Caulobacteraceae bacterium]|jgi:glycosyltransferase involved in cell wall biosynthesis